jgi:transcriptional regulator with AAA-type ATPase domain
MFKSKKEVIFEYLKRISIHDESKWVETEISTKLKLQRSNVSGLLNLLVKEGRIEKTITRPVKFRSIRENSDTKSFENNLKAIGLSGYLKQVWKLAQAALLYPKQSLPTLLIGEEGVGKKLWQN